MGFIEVKDLKVHYPIRGGFFNTVQDNVLAVDGIDLNIESGKTYGLVGESGSGKTTIGRSIIGLEKITSGQIFYEGTDVTNKSRRKSGKYGEYNRNVQMIFQDSTMSLNPKKRILDVIAEPIRNYYNYSDKEIRHRVIELLEIVGLNEDTIYKYPHEFSGGQRQRLGVARAVASNPKLIIADEPTSALDLSVQAQVLNFMKQIQKEYNLSYLFISHDLGVVEHMADDIAIMHKGRFVERGSKKEIFKNPQHIYTKRLLAAIPEMNPGKRAEIKQRRQEIDAEYYRTSNEYYDQNNRVYDLSPFASNHDVAFNPNTKGGN